jgi:hypothetical protein
LLFSQYEKKKKGGGNLSFQYFGNLKRAKKKEKKEGRTGKDRSIEGRGESDSEQRIGEKANTLDSGGLQEGPPNFPVFLMGIKTKKEGVIQDPQLANSL